MKHSRSVPVRVAGSESCLAAPNSLELVWLVKDSMMGAY